MKHPAPKAAQTLEDLDSFFTTASTTESVAVSRQDNNIDPLKGQPVHEKKATIDLSTADWI
jgi:hypothetical protein